MDGKILTNASAIDRSKTEFYPTPPEVTQALIDFLDLHGVNIWEPASGRGDMAKVLSYNINNVRCSDKYDDTCGELKDFLETEADPWVEWIVTNPPFKEAEKFIRHAYDIGLPFAMLVKSQYWHAKSRTKLFKECTPEYVLPLNWRPDFHFGAKGGAPTMEVMWCVWCPRNHRRADAKAKYIVLEKPIDD